MAGQMARKTGQTGQKTGHRTPGQPRARAPSYGGMSGLSGRTQRPDTDRTVVSGLTPDTALSGPRPASGPVLQTTIAAERQRLAADQRFAAWATIPARPLPTCQSCARAEINPLSGLYTLGCSSCAARQLAHAPEYAAARSADAITPEYRAALRAYVLQPAESIGAAHQRVKDWAMRIRGINANA